MPWGLPVPISEMTEGVYDTVEQLNEGDIALCLFGLQPPDYPEIGPHQRLLLQHILNKGAKAVMIDFQWTMGGQMQDQLIIPKLDGVVYGENIVNIGYVPGGGTAQAQFAGDIWGVTQVDFYGNKFEDLPLMQEVHDLSDFAMIASCGIVVEAIGVIIVPSGLPAVRGTWAVDVPVELPNWKAGIYNGILAGSRGASEYGLMLGIVTRANSMMDAISSSHLFMLLLVVVGNAGYFIQRYKKEIE
jgi:hypothetical protein